MACALTAFVPAARAQDAVDVSSAARVEAIRSVVLKRDPAAAAALVARFDAETNANVRAEIVRGAARLEPGQGLALAEKALADPSAWVRLAAVEAIGLVGGKRAATDLAGFLASESNRGVRQAAATWLGILKRPEGEAALSQALSQDDDPDVRLAAAQALKRLGTPSAKSRLKAAENDADARVRGEAHE